MALPYNAPLHRFAVFTAACTLLLVVAGALVTSNDAGLAVPDWPLSYGSLMPPMVGGIFYEHGHRMVATFVGMLAIALAVWIQLREPRPWMRKLGWAALAAVVTQGVLGGLTVLFFLPRPVSIAHASLAQLFFCAMVSIAVFTSRWWMAEQGRVRYSGHPPLRSRVLLVVGAIFIQLVLGAMARHGVLGVWPHVLWAAVVLVMVMLVASAARDRRLNALPVLARVARVLYVLTGLQWLLGPAAWSSRLVAQGYPQPIPLTVGLTVAHVAVGALTLAAAVVMALCALRVLPPVRAVDVSATVHALRESAS